MAPRYISSSHKCMPREIGPRVDLRTEELYNSVQRTQKVFAQEVGLLMDTPDGKKLTAAYAPLNSVVLVIRRVRDRGVPEVVTNELLQSYGVSEGNSPRTLAALKFLGLLADDGRPTPEFERLNRAPSEDAYQQAFAEILRSAYEAVFAIVDPTTAAPVEVSNAFRQYNPPAQRSRMVSLFMGLLSEAKLVDREPSSGQTRRSPKRQSSPPPPPESDGADETPAPEDTSRLDLRSLYIALEHLPREGRWTSDRRNRWLSMFTAALDYSIETQEQLPETVTPPASTSATESSEDPDEES